MLSLPNELKDWCSGLRVEEVLVILFCRVWDPIWQMACQTAGRDWPYLQLTPLIELGVIPDTYSTSSLPFENFRILKIGTTLDWACLILVLVPVIWTKIWRKDKYYWVKPFSTTIQMSDKITIIMGYQDSNYHNASITEEPRQIRNYKFPWNVLNTRFLDCLTDCSLTIQYNSTFGLWSKLYEILTYITPTWMIIFKIKLTSSIKPFCQ